MMAMVIDGEVVDFIGDVALFQTANEAAEFLRQLREAISQRRESAPNSQTWSVPVKVYLLDERAISRYAQERKSHPFAGEAVTFLDRGAVHACQEFGIAYTRSDAPQKVLPSWAEQVINQSYRSTRPFAGADPH
ncbi:MAG: hypothetical protein WA859_02690 [Candidatus Sulfotelmatobacter sp.]|jgi:hypothetical protein